MHFKNILLIFVLLLYSKGLGRGCGAVIGGFFVNYLGTTTTFRGYGNLPFILNFSNFEFFEF